MSEATATKPSRETIANRGTTVRLTMAQALVRFLVAQYSERDGERQRLIAAAFGIFGHGNVAGLGQALLEEGEQLPFYQPFNEQNMVHTAAGYAKELNRRSTMACAASIGPGSTNMITGAAMATINRLPVLLLASDYYATRRQGPVLQQLEHPSEIDTSVNDCFRPVSRFFDRITRPEQLLESLPEAMRILTDPAETGTVTLSLPQDIQAEAFDYPEAFFRERVWAIERRPPTSAAIDAAVAQLRAAQAAVHHRGRRRALLGGVGRAEGAQRGARDPGRRDVRRSWRHPRRLAAPPRRSRRDRESGGGRDRSRGGPRHRRRHPPDGLHHRVEIAVPEPRRQVRRNQRLRKGCDQARRRCGRRGRARYPGGAHRGGTGRRGPSRRGVPRRGRSGAWALAQAARDGDVRADAGDDPAAGSVHRRDQPAGRARRRHHRRRRQRARRPPPDVGCDRGSARPPRVRLLAVWATSFPPGSACECPGRPARST